MTWRTASGPAISMTFCSGPAEACTYGHAEIAAGLLFISVRTVESHFAALRRKLNVGTHRELVRLAAGYLARPGYPYQQAPHPRPGRRPPLIFIA